MKEYLTPMGPTPLHVNPIFEIGPVEPRFSEWLVFEGISVDESGRQHYLDASVAYKRAVLNAIDYISKFGYSKEQVQLHNTKKSKHTCFCPYQNEFNLYALSTLKNKIKNYTRSMRVHYVDICADMLETKKTK